MKLLLPLIALCYLFFVRENSGLLSAETERSELRLTNSTQEEIEFAKASKASPVNAESFYQRGKAKFNLKDYSGALEDFDQAILLQPDFGKAYLERGKTKRALKRYLEASADLEKAMSLNPESHNFYFSQGKAYEKQGEYEKAIKSYTKALEFRPKFEQALLRRGYSRIQIGERELAIKDLDALIAENRSSPEAFKLRAFAYYKNMYFLKAMADYERAKKLYLKQSNFQGYKTVVQSINLLRELMIKK